MNLIETFEKGYNNGIGEEEFSRRQQGEGDI